VNLQLSRSDRVLVGILLPMALLGALIAWLAVPPKKEGRWVREPSTFFNTGSGSKAAYLVVDRLGYDVVRLRHPFSADGLAGIDVLFVLEPTLGLEKEERKALSDWLESGGRMVLAPGVRSFAARMGSSWLFDNWFNTISPSVNSRESWETIAQKRGDSLSESDPLFAGVNEMTARGEFRFSNNTPLKGALAGSPSQVIWADDLGVVAVRVTMGQGRIVAVADTHFLTNRGLDEADNSIFLANLVRELSSGAGRGAIAFDEIHHGFPLGDDPWVAIVRMMLAEHWGWGIVQAAVVLLLALFALGVRFGRPVDVVLKQRRQHGEFAEAAGRTLHDARANDLVYRTLWQHYRGLLCRLVNCRPEATSDELAAALRRELGADLSAALQEAEAKCGSRLSRNEVFAMCGDLHGAVDMLEKNAKKT
jgi:hypothetical protein